MQFWRRHGAEFGRKRVTKLNCHIQHSCSLFTVCPSLPPRLANPWTRPHIHKFFEGDVSVFLRGTRWLPVGAFGRDREPKAQDSAHEEQRRAWRTWKGCVSPGGWAASWEGHHGTHFLVDYCLCAMIGCHEAWSYFHMMALYGDYYFYQQSVEDD